MSEPAEASPAVQAARVAIVEILAELLLDDLDREDQTASECEPA